MASGKCVRWYFNCKKWLPSKEEFLTALSCVQEEERERIMKFVFKKDVKLTLIGRLMVRRCLSTMLSITQDQIQLIRSDKGRPLLANYLNEDSAKGHCFEGKAFDFNASHDGDYCVVAGEWVQKVGIDLSKVRLNHSKPVQEYFKTMEKIFSPQEWTYINMDEEESSQLFRFHRLWALKESFVKATGIGIGFDLRRIRFSCPSERLTCSGIATDTVAFIDGKPAKEWVFEETLLDNHHIVSTAIYGDPSFLENRKSCLSPDSYPIPKTFQELVGESPLIKIDEIAWSEFLAKEEGKTW